MLSSDQALDRLDHLLALARASGADAADAVYYGDSATGIGVRLGTLEEVGRSESEEIAFRLFVGQRSAQLSLSDLSPAALAEAVTRARAMAEEAIPDPCAGLADRALLATTAPPALDLFDEAAATLPPERLREMALAAEDEARAIPGVTGSDGGSASAGTTLSALATSTGFRGATLASLVSISAVVLAGDGDRRQRDYDWHSSRYLADLDEPAAIGRTAAERAIARLDPGRGPTGVVPVLFDRRVSASLLGHLFAAISGPMIARKTSFLLNDEGKRLFPDAITIVDDPLLQRGLNSRPFDGEGLAAERRTIIANGELPTFLFDSASARQLGRKPTGNAGRGGGSPGVSASNLWLQPGEQSPDQLMSDIKDGLYVTELIGSSVNILTGDYSRGASGFRIRDGWLAEPVHEATVSGHLRAMFAHLVAANDLRLRSTANAPTLRIDGMTVAGE